MKYTMKRIVQMRLEPNRHGVRAARSISLLAFLAVGAPVVGGDWPSWRGPEQNGVSRETGLPGTWSPFGEKKNLLWSAPYGARSAPVILGDRLYLLNRRFSGRL